MRIERWSVDGVKLLAGTYVRTRSRVQSQEIEGLLGSDVLSAFGTVTVDYEGQELVLGE